MELVIPSEFSGEEVHFIWDNSSEALLWTSDGVPLQGFYGASGNERRAEYVLLQKAQGPLLRIQIVLL